MALYRLSKDGAGVIRLSDGAGIPNDPNNPDWIKYQLALSQGGVPDPAETPAEIAARQAAELDRQARAVILSNVLGDAVFTALKTKTPAEIDTWIDTNFATLTAQQRLFLKTIAKICVYLFREKVN